MSPRFQILILPSLRHAVSAAVLPADRRELPSARRRRGADVPRRRAEAQAKGAVEVRDVRKADAIGDVEDLVAVPARIPEPRKGAIETKRLHGGAEGRAFALEEPLQIARRDADPRRDVADAKAGIVGLTRALARDYGAAGIRVNCLAPGMVLTEKQLDKWIDDDAADAVVESQCLKIKLQPADMIGPVLFLASAASGAMTGQCLIADAGRQFAG